MASGLATALVLAACAELNPLKRPLPGGKASPAPASPGAPAPASPGGPGPGPAPGLGSPSASLAGRPGPTGQTTAPAAPDAKAPPAQRLVKPEGQVLTVSGVAWLNPAALVATGIGQVLNGTAGRSVVAVGPAQVVAAGGGKVVAAGGGNVVAAGGGKVVAAGGGNVVAAGGGNFVAAGGGNVVAAGGGNVVAAGGGNVIAAGGGQALGVAASNLLLGTAAGILASGGGHVVAAGGGNVVAAGGGHVVAAGGGNVVAAGGGNYRLLQSAEGASLPVAGMVISAISLKSHQAIPLGQDEQGQGVYSVFTDDQGRFEIHLPPEAAGNVLVVGAARPDSPDPRLAMGVMVGTGAKEVQMDPAAQGVTLMVREVFASRLAYLFGQGDLAQAHAYVDDLVNAYSSLPPLIRSTLGAMLKELATTAHEAGLHQGQPGSRMARALRISDLALESLALDDLDLTDPVAGDWAGPPEKPMAALRDLLVQSEAALRTRLAQGAIDPASVFTRKLGHAGAQTHLQVAFAQGLLSPQFRIRNPEEGALLLSRVLFGNPSTDIIVADGVGEFLNYLGLSDLSAVHLEAAKAAGRSKPALGSRVNAAARVLFTAVVKAFAQTEIRTQALALVRAPFSPEEQRAGEAKASGDPAATPTP